MSLSFVLSLAFFLENSVVILRLKNRFPGQAKFPGSINLDEYFMVVNNPNNWHWVDKNCIEWTRTYFKDKLTGFEVTSGEVTVGVSKVSSIEGDVDVCQRKGKIISLFDINLNLEMVGNDKNSGTEFKGSIIVPELTYASESDDIHYETTIYDSTTAKEDTFLSIKKQLLPRLTKLLLQFNHDLMFTHGSDLQTSSTNVSSDSNRSSKNISYQPPESKTITSKNDFKYNTSTLHLEPVFNTTAEQLYLTLLDSSRISAWSRSFPEIEKFPPNEGSNFSFFGGGVNGKILKLIPNNQIIQLWRLNDWKNGHFAELDLKFIQGTCDTKIVVKFTGIPIGEEDRVRNNFEDYYIKSIKITFGFGAVL